MVIDDVPRFVPTLTEVVNAQAEPAPAQPAQNAQTAQPAVSPPSAPADALAAAVLRRLGPELDRRISEAIARALHEQMLGFNSRVRKAVADVVREAVTRPDSQNPAGGGDR